MALALDRKAFIDILQEGTGDVRRRRCCRARRASGACRRRCCDAAGLRRRTSRRTGRGGAEIMEKLGYSAAKPLKIKVPTRNIADLSRPGGDPDRPAQEDLHRRRARGRRHAAVVRQGGAQGLYRSGINLTGVGVDDPDVQFYRELCLQVGAQLHPVLQRRSRQADRRAVARGRRREAQEDGLGDRAHAGEDAARPIIYHGVPANCWQPYVKGYIAHANSIYNDWRFEDIWLDK